MSYDGSFFRYLIKIIQFSQVWTFFTIVQQGGQQAWWARKLHKICLVLNIFITCIVWKKAAVIFNFCLIGIIHHNFLVPRVIELAPKTFMPIQTPDLHRVCSVWPKWQNFFSAECRMQNFFLFHLLHYPKWLPLVF